jgi:UPF0716 protein FxsA
MAAWLFLLFLIVPILELWVIIQVGGVIGALPTIGLLIVVSVVGAWLMKREGLGIWRRVTTELEQGTMPTSSVIDGFLVLFAGALMLTPGFLTDLVGVVLLVPPTRALVRTGLVRRYRSRLTVGVTGFGPGAGAAAWGRSAVVDTDVVDVGDVTPPEWRGPGARGSRPGELEDPRG